MKRAICLIALMMTLATVCPAAAQQCARLVMTGHPSYPPVAWAKGDEIVGASADLVKLIAGELGVETVISRDFGAWESAQSAARQGEADIIFGIYFNEKRAVYLDYVRPAYMMDPVVILTPKGREFPFSAKEDLKGKKGVCNLGESFGTQFDSYMAVQLDVDRLDGVDSCLKALAEGKYDFMVVGLYQGMGAARRLGLWGELTPLPRQLASFPMYVAFSRISPCAQGMREAFAQKIKQLTDDGTVQSLLILNQARWDTESGR